jgi:pimeloyl-ACP methyl ester carboxylesterase
MLPPMAGEVIEAQKLESSELVVDGVRVFYRSVEGEGTPTVYCHGNPTHSGDWLPFLERGGRAIALDLPGWGRSDRPDPSRFDYSMYGLSAFLERFLEQLGVRERKLVVHDWSALALIGAQRRPDLLQRLVLIDAVPLLPGYRWHWVAQLWRRRPLGELLNAAATRSGMAQLLRRARGDHGPMPPPFVDMIWDHWDAGTGRALLALYRHADPPRLAAAGRELSHLSCPALVLWGDRDAYLPARFARAYAETLPQATLEVLPGIGHWPWIEHPSTVDRVLEFLT